MEKIETVVCKVPILYSSKSVFIALEEDRFDHDVQVMQFNDIPFGAVTQRNKNHPRYNDRGADALEIIYGAFPDLIGRDDVLRDPAAGCIIF